MTVGRILILIAVLLFVLAVFHVALPFDLMAAGLAFFAASFLV